MLLKMSISSSILIILIVILRFVALNRLPKKFFVLLWNIAILRLLIPFDLPMHYGLASPMTKLADSGISHYNTANSPLITETLKEPITDTTGNMAEIAGIGQIRSFIPIGNENFTFKQCVLRLLL